jgi:hypothetical protein
MKIFTDNLLNNNTIKNLNLSYNKIKDGNCLFLYNILKNNNNLEKLYLSGKKNNFQ